METVSVPICTIEFISHLLFVDDNVDADRIIEDLILTSQMARCLPYDTRIETRLNRFTNVLEATYINT